MSSRYAYSPSPRRSRSRRSRSGSRSPRTASYVKMSPGSGSHRSGKDSGVAQITQPYRASSRRSSRRPVEGTVKSQITQPYYRSRTRSRSRSRSRSRTRPPQGSWKVQTVTQKKPRKPSNVFSDYCRVPEGGRLYLPEGTIVELLSARYRVEDETHAGVEKDVKPAVLRHIRNGGIDIVVTDRTLGVENRYPDRTKKLIITYVPERADGVVELLIPEGGMFQLPEDSIDVITSAEFRLPHDYNVGHGWGVDVLGVVNENLHNGGIRAMLASRENLRVPYDPFPGRKKVLRVQYIPTKRGRQDKWHQVEERTDWAVRDIDDSGFSKWSSLVSEGSSGSLAHGYHYNPYDSAFYNPGEDHPPSVLASQGTDNYHVRLLQSVLSLLRDVEHYGQPSDRRLSDVEKLVENVKRDRNNRVRASIGGSPYDWASHLIAADPRGSFWSHPRSVLTRMGFTDREISEALNKSQGSLHGAAMILTEQPSHPHSPSFH
eukprot:TRINITY_DN12729_c0_g1_i1.p1 TRINITY_DN12729_c0_g1~~TRINITY_DN12729_c0_g1_i1.p1  ORF type:complete len:501 (+),score=77.54 TRINITY_DN12729_c0_g1_i1:41-1504(+)